MESLSINSILYIHTLIGYWLLGNPEVQYRHYISSPLVTIFSKIYPVPSITTHLLKFILILSFHLHLGLPKVFPLKLYMNCSICAPCLAHLNRLDLSVLIMLVEKIQCIQRSIVLLSSFFCNSVSYQRICPIPRLI